LDLTQKQKLKLLFINQKSNMEKIILTTRQKMLPPDRLAYELGQIPTPEKMQNTKIATYILIGVVATISIGFISYAVYLTQTEAMQKRIAA
jgi:hypothetical protein